MNIDNFELILQNIKELKEYIKLKKSKCKVSTYHLITDNNNVSLEIEKYKKNVIDTVGTLGYIWKMHNWSGNYDNKNFRKKTDRRSCGRPFAEITIRAGGEKGKDSCNSTLLSNTWSTNEEKSILGHLDKEKFEDIYNGSKWNKLKRSS